MYVMLKMYMCNIYMSCIFFFLILCKKNMEIGLLGKKLQPDFEIRFLNYFFNVFFCNWDVYVYVYMYMVLKNVCM